MVPTLTLPHTRAELPQASRMSIWIRWARPLGFGRFIGIRGRYEPWFPGLETRFSFCASSLRVLRTVRGRRAGNSEESGRWSDGTRSCGNLFSDTLGVPESLCESPRWPWILSRDELYVNDVHHKCLQRPRAFRRRPLRCAGYKMPGDPPRSASG